MPFGRTRGIAANDSSMSPDGSLAPVGDGASRGREGTSQIEDLNQDPAPALIPPTTDPSRGFQVAQHDRDRFSIAAERYSEFPGRNVPQMSSSTW